jgi:hypothetical protein
VEFIVAGEERDRGQMGSLNEETGYRYQPESELRRWIGWPLGAPACLLPLLARTHTHGSSAC